MLPVSFHSSETSVGILLHSEIFFFREGFLAAWTGEFCILKEKKKESYLKHFPFCLRKSLKCAEKHY